MKICKVEWCNEKTSARGLCNKHYQRLIHGKPMKRVYKSLLERIFEKVNKTDSCWLWTGAKSGRGGDSRHKYGYIRIDGKSLRVHRVVYEIENNVKIGKKLVIHSCDNPLCVNPKHLRLGTYHDNNHDCINKGRCDHAKGVDNHSKLSEIEVIEIRKRRALGETCKSLGDCFPVSPSTISAICLRKKWKHI